MMFLLVTLALLITPPVLIIALPLEWLALFAPAGALGMYSLAHVFTDGDLGPAGIFILAFFSLVKLINAIALVTRVLLLLRE